MDQQNQQTYNYVVKGHHLYSGKEIKGSS